MIKKEWERLLHNPMLIVIIAAIVLIPSIYAGFFLASMWDPYGQLDKLPVAVVNLDEGAEYDGRDLELGSELVDNLREDGSLDFRFVDAQEAEEGLRDGRYYMVVTIPEDFSHNASTATSEQPEQMELMYETNPATNYVAMKLSESAMNKIVMSLREKVSETYVETMFEQFGTISDSLNEAAEGAGMLLEGESRLNDGAIALNNGANELSDGAVSLQNGTSSLSDGALDLYNGIHSYLDGADSVNSGIRSLDQAILSLSSGAGELNNGASALADGTTELCSGASTLVAGTADLYNGTASLAAGTGDLSQGASAIASGAADLSSGLDALSDNMPALVNGISDLDTGAGELQAGIGNYTEGVSAACEGASQVSSGVDALSGSISELAEGSSDINTNIIQIDRYAQAMAAATGDPSWTQLAGYTSALVSGYGQFNSGIAAVNENMPQLSAGAQQVAGGLSALDSNNEALVNGAAAVAEGASALDSAAPGLSEGVSALREGASQLAEGAAELSAGAANAAEGASAVASGAQRVSRGASDLQNGIVQVDQGASSLAEGTSTLTSGVDQIREGADRLCEGSNELTGNNHQLDEGAEALSSGAARLDNGANELVNGTRTLADGTGELADSIPELSDGTSELQTGLLDGAGEIDATPMNTLNAEMISNPVNAEETRITEVADNGHAMAAYMMSVGLWVASLAFCLMYPLTKHEKLTSGLAWWLSKASVLYPVAVLQAVVLVLLLHIRLGFDPARFAGTVAVACLASMAFMSIMYLFNVLMGKAGSFIMLIFMVLQLAGSAGTYPLEISGPLAQALNRYMPFTYTVTAFRSTIGGGEECSRCIAVLLGIMAVSSILTIALFVVRGREEARGRENLYDWMEARGLA